MDSDLAAFMGCLTTGIYVLTVAEGPLNHHGMSSSWVTQVSGDPPLLMAAVDIGHFSGQVIVRTGVFGLNIVGRRSRHLEDYFLSQASRTDNLQGLRYELSPRLGVPWLAEATACVEACVVNFAQAGDHHLLIASPLGVRANQPDRPLTSLDLDYVYVGGKTVIARDRSGWPDN